VRPDLALAAALAEPSHDGPPSCALDAYARDGFHVAHDVLTGHERDVLAAHATLLAARTGSHAPHMNPHRDEPVFLAALRHPAIVALVERALGGAVSGLQSQLFHGVPGTPGFEPHQDNHYVEAARDAFASAWIALDDARRDNGALYVYPGSHAEPLLPVEELAEARPHPAQAANALRQRVPVPRGYRPITLEVPRGCAALLHGHLIHGSHDNQSRRSRRALLLTYVRRGTPFRPGTSARRSEIDVGSDGGAR
jgi:ectoine hydroxylase-related dioxygenase (phytanoyl-CoA dioxygenase family)